MCTSVLLACMYLHYVSEVPTGARRGCHSPWNWTVGTDQCSLEKQQVLFIPELSLQPPFLNLWLSFSIVVCYFEWVFSSLILFPLIYMKMFLLFVLAIFTRALLFIYTLTLLIMGKNTCAYKKHFQNKIEKLVMSLYFFLSVLGWLP